MDSKNISWLLEGPAWLQYRVRLDLCHESASDPDLIRLHSETVQDPAVQALVGQLQNWPGIPINSHKSAGHPIHQLVFLADLGLQVDDPSIRAITERVLDHVSAQGPFQVLMNVPKHFGGHGVDEMAWVLCDAPLSLYALARFGLRDHPAVQHAAETLAGLGRENGWPCAGSPEMGRFRGPGRKEDPCPFANLIVLQALAQLPGYQQHPAVQAGVETALALWADRVDRHPYLFYMGTDFCKVKAPLVWYDLLHVLDVLTQFPWARSDPRLQAMVTVLREKADHQGRYIPESIWTAWKDWEFGQKKTPSRWVTFLAERIFYRMENQ